MKPIKHLLTLCLLACLLIAPAAAASVTSLSGITYTTYDQIYASSLSSSEKLALVQEMSGWTDELAAYVEWKNSGGDTLTTTNTTSTSKRPTSTSTSKGTTATSTYTEEEQAAYEEQLAAYEANFAANYEATARFAGSGAGTESNPYIITTPAQLQAMADDLTAYYQLGNDVDMSGFSFSPIGSTSAKFTGVLNGAGHVISNLKLSISTSDVNARHGFINYGDNCVIINTGFEDIDYTLSSTASTVATNIVLGGIIGQATGTVTVSYCYIDGGNVYVSHPNTYTNIQFGGIVGSCWSASSSSSSYVEISNCYVDKLEVAGSIKNWAQFGGIFGSSGAESVTKNIIISNCYVGDINIDGLISAANKYQIFGISTAELPQSTMSQSISNSVSLMPSIGVSSGTSSRIYWASSKTTATNNYAYAGTLEGGNTISGGTTSNQEGANVYPTSSNTPYWTHQDFWENTLIWDFDNIWYFDNDAVWTDGTYTYYGLPKLQVFRPSVLPTISAISATPATGGQLTEYTLSVTATTEASGGIASYQWYFSTDAGSTWDAISGATAATYTFEPGTGFVGDVLFKVVVTGADGGVVDSYDAGYTAVKITVVMAPQISGEAASPISGPLSQTVTLSADVSSTVTATYQWQELIGSTWTDISGATSATSTVSVSDSSATTHSYRLVATNIGGSATSSTITYTSVAVPVISSPSASPSSGPLSQTVTLSASVSGADSVQWQELKGSTWTAISGATSATSTVSISDSSATTHNYRLVATNIGGSATSSTITYTSVAVPVISSPSASPSSGPLSQTVTLSASVSGADSVQWQELKGSTWTAISGATSATYSVSVSDSSATTHSYRLVATNIGGTTTGATVTYQSVAVPVISSPSASPTSGPLSQSVTLSASVSGADSVQWQELKGSTWTAISGATSATSTVSVSDSSATIHTYRLVATNIGGSTTSGSVTYQSVAAPVVTAISANPTEGPLMQTVQLSVTATGSDLTYQWQELIGSNWQDISGATSAAYSVSISDTEATLHTYHVVISNAGGTVTSNTVTYQSSKGPEITSISANPTKGPYQQTVQLSATATSDYTISYQWQELIGSTWTAISGATSATSTVSISDTSATLHTYRVLATDIGGTVTSGTVTYQSIAPPTVSTISANPTEGPLTQNVQLSVTAQSTETVTYQWQEKVSNTWANINGATAATYTASISDASSTLHTYRLVATNIGGSTTSGSVTYQSVAVPVISSPSTSPSSGPLSQTVQLSASVSGADSVQWQELIGSTWTDISGATSAAYSVSISDTSATTHSYRLVASNIGGSAISDTVTYQSVAPPVISSPSASPSSGPLSQTVQLSASVSGADSVQWQELQGSSWEDISGATSATYSVSVSDSSATTHSYRLVASNIGGSATSGSVTYQSIAPPVISNPAANPTEGPLTQNVQLSASVSGATAYQWQELKSGTWTDISGATSAAYSVSVKDSAATVHSYRLVASNIGGSTTSDTVTYTSIAPPTVSAISASPTKGPQSQTVTLSATVSGAESYQWQELKSGTWANINGATAATYTATISDTAATLHSYRLIVTNAGGQTTSDTVTYQSIAPPTITNPAANPASGPLSQTVTLSATVSSTETATYQWQELQGSSWEDISGATSATSTVSVSDSGATLHSYRLEASNIGGSSYSDTVTYQSVAPPTITNPAANPTEGPYQQTVQLSASVSGATAYQWQELKSGTWTDISGATSATYSVSVKDSAATLHSYRLEASNIGGSSYSDTVTYQSVAPPTVSNPAVNPTSGPLSQAVVLSATISNADTIQWQELKGSTWQNIDITSASGTVTISDTSATTHTYRVLASNIGGTTTSASVSYTSIAPPTISNPAANPTEGPYQQTVQLSASVSGATAYQWQEYISGAWTDISGAASATSTISVSDTSATTHSYRLVASNIGGSSTSTTVTYQSVTPPTVSSVVSSAAEGPLSTTITLTATVSGADSYQWQELIRNNWQDITGATSATYSAGISDTVSTLHTYRILASNVGGTTTSGTTTYQSVAPPTFYTVTANPTTGPLTQTVQLSATVGGAESYQWQELIGSTWTAISGATSATSTVSVSDSSATTHSYRLLAVNIGGSSTSSTVTYTSVGLPVVSSINMNPTIGKYTETVTLSAVVSGATAYQWQINSGNGWGDIAGATTNPWVGQITFTGNSQIRVVASNTGGSTTSNAITYTVAGPAGIQSLTASPSVVNLPGSTTLAVTGNNIESVTWQEQGATSWTTIGTGETLKQTITTEGTHTYRAVVVGADGTTITTENLVVLAGYAPTVSIMTPVNGAEFDAGATVTAQATITGTDVSYQWDFGQGATGNTAANPADVTYRSQGYKTITITAESVFGTVTDKITILYGKAPRPMQTELFDEVDTSPVDNFVNQFDVEPGEMPNPVSITESLFQPFDDALKGFFWVLVFGAIMLVVWLITKSVALPSVLGVLFGAFMVGFMPDMYLMPAVALIAAGMAGGVLYVIKRN